MSRNRPHPPTLSASSVASQLNTPYTSSLSPFSATFTPPLSPFSLPTLTTTVTMAANTVDNMVEEIMTAETPVNPNLHPRLRALANTPRYQKPSSATVISLVQEGVANQDVEILASAVKICANKWIGAVDFHEWTGKHPSFSVFPLIILKSILLCSIVEYIKRYIR